MVSLRSARRWWTPRTKSGAAQFSPCAVVTAGGGRRLTHLSGRAFEVAGEQVVVVAMRSSDVDQQVAEFAMVQERLMSNISHELRTPLNVVMGFSELLAGGTLGELTEKQVDAARECHIGGERILRLVNDILDIGRARSYHQPPAPGPLESG